MNDKLKLIFAQACAESLHTAIGHVLSTREKDRQKVIEAVATLHYSCCMKMMSAFSLPEMPRLEFPPEMTLQESADWLSSQASSARAIAEKFGHLNKADRPSTPDQPSPLPEHRHCSGQHQSDPGSTASGGYQYEGRQASPLCPSREN